MNNPREQDDFRTADLSEVSQPGDRVQHHDPFATNLTDASSPIETIGDYRILRELGRGGMGVVYEAEKRGTSQRVALKTLQSKSAQDLTRLKSEFRVISEIAQTNIVRLGELDTTTEPPFFTMEILEGRPFHDFVSSRLDSVAAHPQQPYNESRLRRCLRQLAEGLIALHAAGIVHRDLKPSNVLVTNQGRVVILDMGLAIETMEMTSQKSRDRSGTPYFMAPEQMIGESISPAADWYAVGIMLYEALTGDRFFEAKDFAGLVAEKQKPKQTSPKQLVASVPDDLDGLCMRLCHPDPKERPTIDEIRYALLGKEDKSIGRSAWIGREEELTRLQTAWERVKEGEPQVVLVNGLSGLGKTALVDHFLGQLRQREPVLILRGRCYENETVAYRGFDSIVDSLVEYLLRSGRAEIDRVLPTHVENLCQIFPVAQQLLPTSKIARKSNVRRGDAQEAKRRGIAAFREMLQRVAVYTPLIIFVDDLQQGDDETATIFEGLFCGEEAPAALFLGTYRVEDVAISHCVKRIRTQMREVAAAEERGFEEVEVGRLGTDNAMRLIQLLVQEQSRSIDPLLSINAEKIASESQGDPLFIRLLVSYSLRQQRSNEVRHETSSNLSLQAVIEDEVKHLAPTTRKALEIVAAAGCPIAEPDLVALMSGAENSTGLVRELRVKRLIRRLGDMTRIEVFHDKIRETLLAFTPETQIVDHCRELAFQMDKADRDRDVEVVADLYRRGKEWVRASELYEETASLAATKLSFQRAIESYQYALQFMTPNADRERRLRASLAECFANAGRSVEAGEQFVKAADMSSGEEAMQWRRQAAHRYLTSGYVDQGVDILREILNYYRIPWPASRFAAISGLLSRRARLAWRGFKVKDKPIAAAPAAAVAKADACWSAAAGLTLVDPLRGSYFLSETLLRSLDLGSQSSFPRDLAAFMGQVAIGGSRSRRATFRVLKANHAAAQLRSDHYSRAMMSLSSGVAALLRGNFRQSLRNCDQARTLLDHESCAGATWEIATANTFALWSLQYRGLIPELACRQEQLLRSAEDSRDIFAMMNYGTQVTAHLAICRDAPELAHEKLAADSRRLSDRGFTIQHHNHLLATTYTLLYQGNHAEAYERIRDQWKNYQTHFLSFIQQVRIDFRQVLGRTMLACLAASGEKKDFRPIRKVIGQLRKERTDWATAFALAFEASVGKLQGNQELAVRKLTESETLFRKSGMNLFRLAAAQHLATLSSVGHFTRLEKSAIHIKAAVDENQGEETQTSLTLNDVSLVGRTDIVSEEWSKLRIINSGRLVNTLLPGFELR